METARSLDLQIRQSDTPKRGRYVKKRGLLALSEADVLYMYTRGALDDMPTAVAAWLCQVQTRRFFERIYDIRLAVPDYYVVFTLPEAAQYLGYVASGSMSLAIKAKRLVPALSIPVGRGHTHLFFKGVLDEALRRRAPAGKALIV